MSDLLEVRPSRLGRVLTTTGSLVFIGLAVFAAVRMATGAWQWNVNGIALAVVSLVLMVAGVVVIAIVSTSAVRFDPSSDVLQLQMLGLTQTRSMAVDGTTVTVRVPGVTGGFANKYVVLQPGRIPMTFYGTFNGHAAGLNALLRAVTDRHPAAIDKADRRLLDRR